MLVYAKRAPPKEPKRRSRAGCIHCKTKKKKCNEVRPRCDRCTERGLKCEYEEIKPRKRRRISFVGSALLNRSNSPSYYDESWSNLYEHADENEFDHQKWEIELEAQNNRPEVATVVWGGLSDEVEEIIRSDPLPVGPHIRSGSQYPDLAMIAPSPVRSPLQEFGAPLYLEFTDKKNQRALVDHFCNVLSHLIVFEEDMGNPFRQLVLPLSHASSPVMNAIFALSSAHLEYRGVENLEKSLDFHNKALQGLAQLIGQNEQSKREEVLGAIILLVYYEVLVDRGNSNIVTGHLKGAMTIMGSGSQNSTPTYQFLERAFRFYDVIAALSLGTPPNSSSQPTLIPCPYPNVSNASLLSSPLCAVDTLLGLSTELWPIIHRLSDLLSYKTSLEAAIEAGQTLKATVLRTELENTSQAIELALTNWKPALAHTADLQDDQFQPIFEAIRMQSILNNAEAYRHSAFIYLYRTIRSFPRSHPSVQKHTHLSLLACSTVVKQAEQCLNGPMSALLWPLFVAACEAITESDRKLALDAFSGTERRQGMNNIAKSWEVVQEVWRRADLVGEDGVVNWRDVCFEMGFNIVLG